MVESAHYANWNTCNNRNPSQKKKKGRMTTNNSKIQRNTKCNVLSHICTILQQISTTSTLDKSPWTNMIKFNDTVNWPKQKHSPT